MIGLLIFSILAFTLMFLEINDVPEIGKRKLSDCDQL